MPEATGINRGGNGPQFKKLMEPFHIGQMEIRNRIVLPAMVTRYSSRDGLVTERIKNYYGARARGGVGLVIVEASNIHPRGRIRYNQINLDDDKFIPGLAELAAAIKEQGARAAIQLTHAGRLALREITGMQPLAPSAIPMVHFVHGTQAEPPREMTVEEIAELVRSFADAAWRVKKAGFDAVELHAASGYLFAQFLSGASNQRRDAYGGKLENRARFLIETIRAVKEKVGANYPVWCRINAKEYGMENGVTLDEAKETALMTQRAGADAVHVTATGPQSLITVGAIPLVSALNVDLAWEVKKTVAVPVITVGLISPEVGERLIAEGKADFIAMGRALIAEPELPNKLASGRLGDIRPCLVCMTCPLQMKGITDPGLRCQVNAIVGKEEETKIVPASRPRRVLVVGGGPAGMEAARVAALKGHEVSLYEKQTKLGGHLLEASIAPHKERVEALSRYLQAQIQELGVKVFLGREVNSDIIEEVQPDVVLIATGAAPAIPDIAGARSEKVVNALEVLGGLKDVGEEVVIIGGGLIGCETAEFLAERGKRVTILEMLDEIGSDIGTIMGPLVWSRLKNAGVRMETGIRVTEIRKEGVTGVRGNSSELFAADAVVLATGLKPERRLAERAKGKAWEVQLIGDCVEPRRIMEAVSEGSEVARQI